MKELKEGNKAPDFKLPASNGEGIKLSEFKGMKVVLYFYPKDMTSGCTTEANDFTKLQKKFQKKNAVILGVSPDSIESHLKFIKKEKIKFLLLSDENKKVSEKYGVWKEKSMYGRKYMGIERSTFIIDENGKIEMIFRKVKVSEHAEKMCSIV